MLDYGTGNVHSAVHALERAGAEVTLTSDLKLLNADGLVVPGVGAFNAVMSALSAVGGDDIIDRRLGGGRPVMAICVGMQVLFEAGVERGADTEGLRGMAGHREAVVPRRRAALGWNTIYVRERPCCSTASRTSASTSCTPTVCSSGTST